MKKELASKEKVNNFILYITSNGDVKVEVFLHKENIWLTQKRIAELFGVGIPAVSKHLENIYSEGELNKDSTVSKLEIVQRVGDRK